MPPDDPDWSIWSHADAVALEDAVALSIGLGPGGSRHQTAKAGHSLHRPSDPGRDHYHERLSLSLSHLGRDLPLAGSRLPPGVPAERNEVRLMDFAKFASRMGWDLDDHFPWKELAYTDDKGNKVVLVNVDGKQMVRTPAGGYISQEQFHAMTHPLHEPIPPEVAIAASMKEAISSKVSVVQLVPTSKPKPDWETWGSIPDTSIINAVALSCNVEPNTLANEFVGAGADPTSELHQFWKRLLIASANAINGALKRVRSNPGTTLLPPCIFDDVSLIELSTWAEGLPYPWELPAGFPRSSGPRKQAPPAGPPVQQPTAATVGITVSLPHTTTDLEAVFKVMRECWADSNIPPMQKDVAAALDKAIGRWNVPKGKAVSRESEIVASLICHDSHKRARKRDDI